jgi:hypothetical protein
MIDYAHRAVEKLPESHALRAQADYLLDVIE